MFDCLQLSPRVFLRAEGISITYKIPGILTQVVYFEISQSGLASFDLLRSPLCPWPGTCTRLILAPNNLG